MSKICYEKGINYLDKVCSQPKAGNHKEIAEFPNNIMVEVTNACNLTCVMCSNRIMKREKGFMDEETYNLVLDNAKKIKIRMIGLYCTGESLMHPKIFKFINIAKQKGFEYVYLTTNGILLEDEKIEKIFESGLDSIKFSIDAVSKEVYDKVRKGGDFNKLCKNIKNLREMRDKMKSKLKIYGSFVITKDNYKELEKANEFWEKYIDEMNFSVVTNQSGHVGSEFEKMVPRDIKSKLIKIRARKKFCELLWNRIIVTYDGKLTICSEDFEAKLVYGDLHEETMEHAWNNEKMRKYRRSFIEGKFELNPQCKFCMSNLDDSKIINEEFRKIKNE